MPAGDITGSELLIAGGVIAGFPPVGASLSVDDLKGYAMPGRFEGQVAIVTGGALGIGGATARRLAAEGAQVLIADINDAAAAANVARIEAMGGAVRAIHTDVAVSQDIAHMVAEAVGVWGRLDILVQN